MLIEDLDATLSWGNRDGEAEELRGAAAIWLPEDVDAAMAWAARHEIDGLDFAQNGRFAGVLVALDATVSSIEALSASVLAFMGRPLSVIVQGHATEGGSGLVFGARAITTVAAPGGRFRRHDVVEFTGEDPFPGDLAGPRPSSEVLRPSARAQLLTEAVEHLERVEGLVNRIRDSRDAPDTLGDAMLEPLLEQSAQLTEYIQERIELGDAQFEAQGRPLWVEIIRRSWGRIIDHIGTQALKGADGELRDAIEAVVDLIDRSL